MSTAPLLPSLLRVLDRAEAEAALPTEAPDRERLLALAKAIRPDHPVTRLEAAVDEELAQMVEGGTTPPSRMPVAPLPKGIQPALGWARPNSEAERAQRQGRPAALRRTKWWKVGLVSLGAFAFGGLLFVGLLYLIPSQPGSPLEVASRHKDVWSLWFLIAPLVIFLTAISSSVAAAAVDIQVDEASQTNLEECLVDLPRPLTTYLANPTSRSYLSAVLESGLPYLMVEDVKRLEAQIKAAEVEQQRQQEEADRPRREAEARERMRQHTEQTRQQEARARARMAEVATLLAHPAQNAAP